MAPNGLRHRPRGVAEWDREAWRWGGGGEAGQQEKSLGVDSASLNAANPASRVHALLGGILPSITQRSVQTDRLNQDGNAQYMQSAANSKNVTNRSTTNTSVPKSPVKIGLPRKNIENI